MALCYQILRETRAEHTHQRAIVVRVVFGALPNSLGEDLMQVCGEVMGVPEQPRLRVVAKICGRVSLEAGLTGRSSVCTESTLLLLAIRGTEALRSPKVLMRKSRSRRS